MGERKVSQFKIEKGIPIPTPQERLPSHPLCLLFLQMEEGDSVLLDHERSANVIRSWLYQRDRRKKKTGEREIWAVIARTQEGGCRVWKVKRKLDE